jgi:hypothetical protein
LTMVQDLSLIHNGCAALVGRSKIPVQLTNKVL